MSTEINWKNGYTSRYYVTLVDPKTFGDTFSIDIISGSIERDSKNNLLQSANFVCKEFDTDQELWVRFYVDVFQDGDTQHEALFTGLATSQNQTFDGGKVTQSVQCYSVLKPADDVLLTPGWFAPKGYDGAKLVQELLSVTKARITISENVGSKILDKHILAESGETNMSMAKLILDEIKCRLVIDGHGNVTIDSISTSPVTKIDYLEDDIIEVQIQLDNEWYNCPNVIRVTKDDTMVVVKDYDSLSRFSIDRRGREIWMEEDCSSLAENDTLADYAKRRLKEEQNSMTTISYTRRYLPEVNIDDVITMHYPKQNIQGDYKVISQSIELGNSVKVSEKIEGVSSFG